MYSPGGVPFEITEQDTFSMDKHRDSDDRGIDSIAITYYSNWINYVFARRCAF